MTFNPSAYDGGVKAVLGRAGAFDAPGAVDVVLSHPSHAPHLINKLWAEFIATPIPPATLAALTAAYTAGGGLRLAPVLGADGGDDGRLDEVGLTERLEQQGAGAGPLPRPRGAPAGAGTEAGPAAGAHPRAARPHRRR